MDIYDNMLDLMQPFQKRWFYCRDMQGSYSIKYVLPALFPGDPELDYHNLEGVHNGAEASAVFEAMADMPKERFTGISRAPTEILRAGHIGDGKSLGKLREVAAII